jgi:hypothetical protein
LTAETSIGPIAAWPPSAPAPLQNGPTVPYAGAASSFPGTQAYGSPYPAQPYGQYAPDPYEQQPYGQQRLGKYPGPAKRTPVALIVVLAVLVLAAGGGGAYWFLTGRADTATAVAPAAAANPVTVAGTRPAPVTSDPPVAPASISAGEQLATQVQRDQPTVESVVGQWVPQIGSKQVGTVANGVTYDATAIWGDVLAAKTRFPQAVLLRSDDYSSFKRGGFWVTIVATPFSSAAEANDWCATNGLGRDECFAKRLSHSEGPQGNTVPR